MEDVAKRVRQEEIGKLAMELMVADVMRVGVGSVCASHNYFYLAMQFYEISDELKKKGVY